MLEAIISFMPSEGMGAIGALDWTVEERKKLATEVRRLSHSIHIVRYWIVARGPALYNDLYPIVLIVFIFIFRQSKSFCCSVCGKVADLLSDPALDAPSLESEKEKQALADQIAQMSMKVWLI